MEQQTFGTEAFDHISYSQVTTYLRCPYLWAQKKYWKREQPVNDALLLGKAVHEALYVHCRLFLEQGIPDLIEAAELAWIHVNKSCDILERPLPPQLYDEGLQMIKDTVGYEDLRYDNTSLVEQEFRIQLSHATVVGRIDRIDELAPGVYNLVDYKTSWAWPKEEDVEEDLELAIYAAAWREICQDPDIVIFVTLHNVRRSIVVRVEKTQEQMDATVEYLQVMWERMRSDRECAPTPGMDSCLKYGGCWAASWCPAHRYCEIPCDDGNKELPVISDENLYKLYITMERWLPVIRSQVRGRIRETGEIKLVDSKQIALAPVKRKVFNSEYEDILWARFSEYLLPGEVGKIDPKKLENRFLDIASRIKNSDIPMLERQDLLETLDDMQANLYVEKAGTPKIVLEERG
jgi:hypothetical protein